MSDVSGLDVSGFGYVDFGTTDNSPQAVVAPSGGESTIKQSDKELTEELVAMMPKSWIDPTFATNVWQNLDVNLGLSGILNIDRAAGFSVQQASVVMAMLASFGKSLEVQAEALREDVKKDDTNPLILALKRYIKSGGQYTSIDCLDLLQMIRSSPILASALQGVDQNLFRDAYKKAELDMATTILSRWVNVATGTDEEQITVSVTLLDNYLDDVQDGKQTFNQTALSILVAGIIGGESAQVSLIVDPNTGFATIDPTKDSLLPVGLNPMLTSLNSITGDLPPEFAAAVNIVMAQILTNSTIAAGYLSIPASLSISQVMPSDPEGTYITKASAYGYAIYLSQFVVSPEFEAFVSGALLRNVPPEQISPEKLEHFIATMKVLLLSNAMAALDKIETGGIIIRGADIQTLLSGKSDPSLPEGDLRLAMATDINTLLASLPNGGQALLQQLLRYFDTNPNVTIMLDPSKAFLALSDPRFANEAAVSQRG